MLPGGPAAAARKILQDAPDSELRSIPQEYNRPMGSLLQPSPITTGHDRDSNWLPIVFGVLLVVIVVIIGSLLLRTDAKIANAPHPYAANIQFSDLKMSAAENFVGSSVTYLDGTVTNTADKTVTRALVSVSFKDSLGQIVQADDVPLRILQTSGPYPEALDLTLVPLAAAQSKPFRLTFEHVTADWNHEYPELKVTDVSVK
jgi:hypothetical protein